MEILSTYVSPDRNLRLVVQRGAKGELAVGFDGHDWHTHPDVLAAWLGVPEHLALERFIELLTSNALPIIESTDGGKTFEPWVSDNLAETLRAYGSHNCRLRYWSAPHAP
jgi:hypothetical protein